MATKTSFKLVNDIVFIRSTFILLAGLFGQEGPFQIIVHDNVSPTWILVDAARRLTDIHSALVGVLVFGSLIIMIPKETPVNENEKMDWIGSALGIIGLIIVNFVWKYAPFLTLLAEIAGMSANGQAPKPEWALPYDSALLIVRMLFLITFAVWESRFTTYPIMPLTIFRAPSFGAVLIIVLFSFMSYGTFIWYMIAWQQKIRHWSVLSTAWGLTPLAMFSALGTFIAAWLVLI